MAFGETVRRLRQARGWTLAQAAQEIGRTSGVKVSPQAVGSIESGKHENPSDLILRRFALVFDLTVAQLRREAGLPMSDPDSRLDELPADVVQKLLAVRHLLTDDDWASIVDEALMLARKNAEIAALRGQREAPAQP